MQQQHGRLRKPETGDGKKWTGTAGMLQWAKQVKSKINGAEWARVRKQF